MDDRPDLLADAVAAHDWDDDCHPFSDPPMWYTDPDGILALTDPPDVD